MKPLLLLPGLMLLGACAQFGARDAGGSLATTGDEVMISASGESMMVGGVTTLDGTDYETYSEHLVDTSSGTLTGTRHFVVVEGETLDCPQADCAATVAQYYDVPSAPVATTGPNAYVVR